MNNQLAHDQDSLAAGPTIDVNSDLTKRIVLRTGDLAWSPSPWIPGIDRKFLDRYGNGQFVPSTSVVSFGTGVRDPYHAHPHGEEFLVLSGVFTDHTGDYLPGFYVRHPIRWCHSPYVDMRNAAAVVWVKVSQISQENEPVVVIDTCDLDLADWNDAPSDRGRIRALPLYQCPKTGERVWIELWESGAAARCAQPEGGEEVFVVGGSLIEDGVTHPELTWIRNPAVGAGHIWDRASPLGCKLLMKSGHLPAVAKLYEAAKDGSRFSSSVKQYAQHERIHGDPHGVDEQRRARGD